MIWYCLSDAVLKLAYAILTFPQIADSQGYAVAEAFIQVGDSNDDGSAKQLDLAIKVVEKEFDRKAKRGRAEYGSGGGYGRGGGRGGRGGFAGGRHAPGPGPPAAGKALMPLAMLLLRGLALLRCQQHPTSLLGTLWHHLALGQLKL